MTIYIALLRGINVGGKNIIKMAELKRILEEMGLNRVQTYIQSGNVLFVSDEAEEPLRQRMEREIEASVGFAVPVMLRTAEQIKTIAANCPFTEEELATAEASIEGGSLYVAMLLAEPAPEKGERLSAYRSESEDYRMVGREIYLLFSQSVRNSKLARSLMKLDVPATTRNWKTINKLVALSTAMESKG